MKRDGEEGLTFSWVPRSAPIRYFSATSSRASRGHSENQLMVVQFTKAGYWRIQFLAGGCERQLSPFADLAFSDGLCHKFTHSLGTPMPHLCAPVSPCPDSAPLKADSVQDLETGSGVRKSQFHTNQIWILDKWHNLLNISFLTSNNE